VLQRAERTVASSRRRPRASLVPVLLILASLVLRPACGEREHRARVAVFRETEQRRAWWERCMYRCQMRVMAANRLLPLPSRDDRLRPCRAGQVLVFCNFRNGAVRVCACPGRDPCNELINHR
jgi:hypothetical protein